MASRLVLDTLPLGDRRLRRFVELPWELHRDDPCWIPPFKGELLGSRLLGIAGLLTSAHPYHREAEVVHFLARRGRSPLGRVSAAVNHRYDAHHGSGTGFFGFFESVNEGSVAAALLDAAGEWLHRRGCTVMQGSGGYSTATHEPHQGILIDGFDAPPTVELTHNPPYYGELLEAYGLRKAKDYHAYMIPVDQVPGDRTARVAQRARRKRAIETRPLSMSRLAEEVARIVEVYNEAWKDNWGFLPLAEAEADAMAASLRLIADPGLLHFAYVEGELAAVLGALPDPYVAMRPWRGGLWNTDLLRGLRLVTMRRRIRKVRLMFFGIRPKYRRMGIDAVLYSELYAHLQANGYRQCEASMLLEDNALILLASRLMGGERYKTWRIFAGSLS